MSAPATAITPGSRPWGAVAALSILGAAALWFVQDRARQYAAYDATSYADFWPRRGGLIVHMSAGLVAISVGLIQLWLGLTARTGTLHRTLGRIYLGAVAVGSTGAFYLALTIDRKYFAYAAGLFMLAVAWIVTTATAYVAIRGGAVQQHREWMIRSYIVTFAFVTFRLAEKLLLHWRIAGDDQIDTMLAWGCWAVPLLLAEPLLLRYKLPRGVA